MDIKNLRFNEAEFVGKDVASLPDNPSQEGIGTAELKARFDNVPKMMIALGKHNELIDALAGTEGAGNIGTQSGESIQAQLDAKILKSDIVQLRGRSTTQVMSQKAVTDAIDAGGGGGGGTGDAEPTGCMKFFAGEVLPDGYLWCDGASYPANGVYKKLYDIVGTRYNKSGDAAGMFRVPDMRGRVGVGKDAGTFGALGKTGGEEKHVLTVAELAAHMHNNFTYDGNRVKYGGVFNAGTNRYGFSLDSGGTDSKECTGNTGGGQPHNNLQPYLVCNYIIKFDRSYGEIGVTAPPCIWEIKQEDWQALEGGGYVLNIPESEHRRGEYCVLTALYDTTEAGKLKAVLFEMEKDEAGNIAIYSDTAFAGKAYIDRVYMVAAGRILSVNGQGPDVDGDVRVDTPDYMYGVYTDDILIPASTATMDIGFSTRELDQIIYDTAGNGHSFVIASDGVYQMCFNVRLRPTPPTGAFAALTTNGLVNSIASFSGSGATCTWFGKLRAGDVVRFRLSNQNTAITFYSDATNGSIIRIK